MLSQLRQHHDPQISRPVPWATQHSLPLLLTAMSFLSLPAVAFSQLDPRFQPDGAPGENLAPGAAGERFAQAATEEADNAAEAADDITPLDKDDAPRLQRNLDNIDFRAPVIRSKQAVWHKIERAVQGRDWGEVLQRIDRFIGPVDNSESEDYVIRHEDGSLRSARLSTARLLGSLPKNRRVARARAETTLANTLFQQAVQENSLRQLSNVAVRFFGSPVGYLAADQLAAQLVDRGEFALAASWLSLLQNSDASMVQSSAWQKKAGLIHDLTSQPKEPATLTNTIQSLRAQFVSAEPSALSQWPVPGGNSRRHAEPLAASRPVMIRRWEFPTTSHPGLRSTIERLVTDLTYRSVPTTPAAAPIFIDGRLVCRTFRGIEVLDVESGEHLWTTAESSSVERLLGSASPDTSSVANLTANMTPLLSASTAVDRTGGPIGQFLFQNAAHGLISSDGKNVYFMEDDPVFTLGRTSIRRVNGANASPRPDSTTSNRLKAFDLETGQPAWQIGGSETNERHAPELAGWFFLGAPLPDRGDLFIVGQKENVIRLFCLNPATGSAKWSQQIAFAEEGLERNLNRRLWSAQLATAHGIVVCPTTVGWLVGVDRSTGTIVWSHRYSERRPAGPVGSPRLFRGNRGGIKLANESIGNAWVPAAPIVMGDRVVFAPSEPRDESDSTTRFLDCVNVFTGQRIWSLPREQALAVTGTAHGQTIVTWPNSIVILQPDGKTRAEIEFDSEDGLPCGRGVAANGSFWIPLQKNVLLRFNIEKASLAERIEVAGGYPALGNLAFYEGLLISHAPEGITAWELEESLSSRLTTFRSSGDTAKADILQAQVALSRKEFSAAIDILLPRLSANPDTILHESILQLLMQAASGQVESKPEVSLTFLAQVQPLLEAAGIEGAEFERRRRQLEVEALIETDRLEAAFGKLLDLEAMAHAGNIKRVDDPRISVSTDVWLARRLALVWNLMPPDARTRNSARVVSLIDKPDNSDASEFSLERTKTLFGFHPAARKLVGKLAGVAIAEQRLADAEHWLQQIAETSPHSQAAKALIQRLQLRLDLGIVDTETQQLAKRLKKEFFSATLPDGTAVSVKLKPLLTTLENPQQAESSDWGTINLVSTRTAPSQQNRKSPRLIADRPSNRFRATTSASGTGSNRLSFFERGTGELFWTVSLRSTNSPVASSDQRLDVYEAGPLNAVLGNGVLNILSLAERRVLWTQPIEDLDNARRIPTKRGQPLEDIDEWILRRRTGSMDAVPVFNSSYLCSRASRSLSVFDSRTGKLRWRLEPLERSMRIAGTRNAVFLTRPDGTFSAAHDALDGKLLASEPFGIGTAESGIVVKVDERSIVTITKSSPDEAADKSGLAPDSFITMRSVNPETKEELWNHEFSAKCKARMISNDNLAILARFGRIKLLNFRTGNLTEFEKIPTRLRLGSPEYTILSDGRILFLTLERDGAVDSRQPGLPSVRLNGHLLAFEISTGKLLWSQEVLEQYLITERLDQVPFLITTNYRRNFLRQPNELRRIMVLDKQDGKVLLDTKDEPGEAAFHSMLIDMENRHVDLLSNAERLRLQVVPVAK